MKLEEVNMVTSLQMQELGLIFQGCASSMQTTSGKLGGLFRGSGFQLEFFTPQDDSPFSALDTDKPHFSVGVTVPKFSGGGGGAFTVQMYVWDRGDHREVTFATPFTMGNATSSKRALASMADAVRGEDPTARTAT